MIHTVLKMKLRYITNNWREDEGKKTIFNIDRLSKAVEKGFEIGIETNQIFNFIKELKHKKFKDGNLKDSIIFVDVSGANVKEKWTTKNKDGEWIEKESKTNKQTLKDFKTLFTDGFIFKGKRFKLYGKSASMGRNKIVAFLEDNLFDEINKRSLMDLEIDQTVISKFENYKNLLFTSCRYYIKCEDEKLPLIIIIKDYKKTINNQHIKYVKEVEEEIEFKNSEGVMEKKKFKNLKVFEKTDASIEIQNFDGMGIHSNLFSKQIKDLLKLNYDICSIQIRMPFMKGLSTEFDILGYMEEKGITQIVDAYGTVYTLEELKKVNEDGKGICIWTESMWKGCKYFEGTNDKTRWEVYLDKFKKYNHSLGISNWNHPVEIDKTYARTNYQYLQALSRLTKKNIIRLAKYSMKWAENILSGNKLYTYLFLGMLGSLNEETTDEEGNITIKDNKHMDNISSKFIEAIALNPIMLKDEAVKEFVHHSLEKIIDQMKLGRLFLPNSRYSYIVGDLIGFMEWSFIHQLPSEELEQKEDIKGCLKEGEFYSSKLKGIRVGFRSPLIHSCEPNVMKFVHNKLLNKWCSHLNNVVMLNMNDLTLPRLGGADEDGDKILTTNSKIIINAINKNTPVVIDMADKEMTAPEKYNTENIIAYHKRTLDNKIGTITLFATHYSNTIPGIVKITKENKDPLFFIKRKEENLVILRILQGKEIDFQKTGKRLEFPKYMKNEAKTRPYFLRYNYKKLGENFDKLEKELKKKYEITVDTYKTLKELEIEGKKETDTYKNLSNRIKEYGKELYSELESNGIQNDSSNMNYLCWSLEKWHENLKINKFKELTEEEKQTQDKILKIILPKDYSFTDDLEDVISSVYGDYKTKANKLKNNPDTTGYEWQKLFKETREELEAIRKEENIKKDDLENRIIYYCYNNDKVNRTFCWNIVPNRILENLSNHKHETIELPVETTKDDPAAVEFLGRCYKLTSNKNDTNVKVFLTRMALKEKKKELLRTKKVPSKLIKSTEKCTYQVEENYKYILIKEVLTVKSKLKFKNKKRDFKKIG